jgi:hypothetical protein
MPPIARPFPRFIADATQEGPPTGRFKERLDEKFAEACAKHASDAGSPLDPESIRWFPERAWGGRVWVPATGYAQEESVPADAPEGSEPVRVEYFGWVSYRRDEDGAPVDFEAKAEFTDVTAEHNPDWQVDLSDDVIGEWRSDGGRGGDVTLIWGLPLIGGAVAATAELDGEVLDQAPVRDGRFTLVAVDAVHGFGDRDLYVEIKLWDRRLREIASESLYASEDEAAEE